MTDRGDQLDYDRIWTQVYGDAPNVGPVHRHMKRIVSELLAQIEYESILDVGCGPGYNLPMLCEGRELRSVAGLDISAWAINQARNERAGEFRVLDIQQERLDGSWDLVYCSLVLEHLTEDLAALHNMRAMTDKYLLTTTIAGDFERYRKREQQVGHVRSYEIGELEEKLRDVGFVVQKAIYWGFPFYSPLGRTLQACTGVGHGNLNRTASFLANVMYRLYFLNSCRRGDLLVVLATA
jgi:SAM-dependent methyltransferase